MSAPLRGDETRGRAKPIPRSPWVWHPFARAHPAEKPTQEHHHG